MSNLLSHTRTRALSAVLVVVASLAAAACFRQAAPGAMPDNTVITEAEIDSAHVFNAYDAIHHLRPMFLVSRGKMSFDPRVPPALPNVYVDEQYYGDASTLRAIEAATIERIKFYNSSEAQLHYGRGNTAGVIAIATKH